MEDWKGFMSTKTRGDNSEDFEEGDMWNQYSHEDQDHYSSPTTTVNNPILLSSGSSSSSSFSSSSSWKLSNKTTPKSIPRRAQTTTKKEAKVVQVQQSSAPMNIPDWSKIYGKSNNASWACDDHDDDHDRDDHDDGDDDDDDMVPPHEWIARKLARSQISSFSVFEGIGRTLKGRDLSKVRNAILTKTGFLE